MAVDSPKDEDPSIRHLLALGYVDPDQDALSRVDRRRRREAELRRATELVRAGKAGEAVGELERLVGEEPDWYLPHQLLAELRFGSGDWPRARHHLDWLAHHNVVAPRLAVMTATMALQRRDLCTAMADVEYACHVEPTRADAWSLLGTVQMRLRRWEDAEAAFRKALLLNGADARALDGLASAALRRGDVEGAAHRALEAIEHDMACFGAHYHLGLALVALGRAEAGAQAFALCARLDPSRAAPLCWLARIARACGDDARANEYRARALEILRRRRAGETSTPRCPSSHPQASS